MTKRDHDHLSHLRPDGERGETEVILAKGGEVEVDEEVAYEDRFVEGGGSSSGYGGSPAAASDEKSGSSETATFRTKRTPIGPSGIARIKHEDSNHMPYRDWCTDCVRGRGVADPHVSTKAKQEAEGRENREICKDYCFPSGVKGGGVTVLAVRSRRCGSTFSIVMPAKNCPSSGQEEGLPKQ